MATGSILSCTSTKAHPTSLRWILAAAVMAIAASCAEARGCKRGDVVFKMDCEKQRDRSSWSAGSFAAWVQEGKGGGTALKVTVPSTEQPGHHKITVPIDLKPYRGMKLFLSCQSKALGVSKPPQSHNGVKWMLHYKTPTRDFYNNQNNVYGTYGWKEISFVAHIDEEVQSAELVLGLEMSTGEAWFDDMKITVAKLPPPVRPKPAVNAPPAYKGHNLPRLRGAMSPNAFKDEDFRVFANEWNANLVRWQMTRQWGQANTDIDLEEYSKWIDSEMKDIDLLLAAALKYRFKVVIDLHSPPGGRHEDNSMRMFYEKKYNDCFVEVWKRFARRYKGHPAVWGYDLINEPVETRPTPAGMDYHETQARAAKAIRAIDPKTTIIVEAIEWCSPRGYLEMIPFDVKNVVYQVHMYEPHAFTHQGVSNAVSGVRYPGRINDRLYDKAALREVLSPVREFQQAYNVHIYVGEFSAIRWAPGAAQYLSDCIEIFEEYGWDWSYHAYREWQGWSVEHANEPVDRNKHVPAATTDRKEVLLRWFAKNEKPVFVRPR